MTEDEEDLAMRIIYAFIMPFILIGAAFGFIISAALVTVPTGGLEKPIVLIAAGAAFIIASFLSNERSRRAAEQIRKELGEEFNDGAHRGRRGPTRICDRIAPLCEHRHKKQEGSAPLRGA